MNRSFALEIFNDREHPHIVWIEPWGADITMLPKDELLVTIVESTTKEVPWFSLVETESNTQVYVEQGGYPQVQINGVQVECGHNRQRAIDAGIWPD